MAAGNKMAARLRIKMAAGEVKMAAAPTSVGVKMAAGFYVCLVQDGRRRSRFQDGRCS